MYELAQYIKQLDYRIEKLQQLRHHPINMMHLEAEVIQMRQDLQKMINQENSRSSQD